MLTAYLILAHHQPHHLARLINALQDTDSTFFIHIDAKVDEAPFRKAVGAQDNVAFIKRRPVNWGGFSIVEATLNILEEAWKSNLSFHRFCLLSGSGYPIKSKAHIKREFGTAKQFMRVDRSVGASVSNLHTDNVRFYWFMDAWGPISHRLGGRIARRPYGKIELYHGSAWWALTRGCVDYIFEFLSSHRDYQPFFKHARCSDEIFFQSIVKSSPFAAEITHDFEIKLDLDEFFRSNEHGCQYIDWNAQGERLPKVLDLLDLHKLLNSDALFARKFEEQRSRLLLDELERIMAGPIATPR